MKNILLCLLLTLSAAATAQKQVYVPDEWRYPWNPDTLLWAENDPQNKYTWSLSRSIQSDNVIVFWDKGYGSTLPSKAPSAYRVDEQDLLQKCESFYDLEINKLGFVDPETTNLRKYKVMVLLSHTTDWVCYGGGYDFEVSALWLGPSACKPVGHSVAHEVGHSFHYMCYADASGNNHNSSSSIGTGFHLPCGNGQAIWEQTAQWQAAQSYPGEMFNQSIGVFRHSHNYAFSHEWHRYQSYWLHYYLCQKYNDITTVAQVWRQPMTGGVDFNQALMKLKGLDANALFKLYYDYAAHLATWDIDVCAPYRNPYIGDFDFHCVMTADSTYQVALSSAPQSSGFNIIPLQVPEAGTVITTDFTALRPGCPLAEGDPGEMLNGETQFVKQGINNYVRPTGPSNRAFRIGYVALMNDGTRQYIQKDTLYCQTQAERTDQVTMTVPEGTSRLWLIVVPAPKAYKAHEWRDKATNAEHWPYRIHLNGTDIGERALVYATPTLDGRPVGDITLTYDVYMPPRSGYDATTLTVSGQALATVGTALQIDPTTISSKMQSWSSSGPAQGRIMFYPLNPTTLATVNNSSTANGYGHWFNASGAVCSYTSTPYVYSEFQPSTMTFNIGQYPNKCKAGSDYTIGQALRYRTTDNKYALAKFIFRIHITNDQTGTKLATMEYENTMTAITAPKAKLEDNGAYDLMGRPATNSTHGIVISNGKKIVR